MHNAIIFGIYRCIMHDKIFFETVVTLKNKIKTNSYSFLNFGMLHALNLIDENYYTFMAGQSFTLI